MFTFHAVLCQACALIYKKRRISYSKRLVWLPRANMTKLQSHKKNRIKSKCYKPIVTRRLLVVANEIPTAYVIGATNRCCKNVGTSLPFTTSSGQKQKTYILVKTRCPVTNLDKQRSEWRRSNTLGRSVCSFRSVRRRCNNIALLTNNCGVQKDWRSRNFKSPSLSFLDVC